MLDITLKPSIVDRAAIKKHLEQAFWDYDFDPEELYALLTGARDRVSFLTRPQLYQRLLKTYPWYTLIDIVGVDQLPHLLDPEIIRQIWPKSLQKRYDRARAILQQSTVSPAGPGPGPV